MAQVGLNLNSENEATNNQDCGTDYYQYCTAIPIGTALAQSWNDDLVFNLGNIIGNEMELFGIDIWLAPTLNIQR